MPNPPTSTPPGQGESEKWLAKIREGLKEPAIELGVHQARWEARRWRDASSFLLALLDATPAAAAPVVALAGQEEVRGGKGARESPGAGDGPLTRCCDCGKPAVRFNGAWITDRTWQCWDCRRDDAGILAAVPPAPQVGGEENEDA